MTSWKTVTLAEFVTLKRGMDLPHGRRRPGRYRVLSSGESQGTHDAGPVKGPGFAVGRATNIGRPTWSDDDYWPLNTVLYAADFKGNDPKFVYYWFLANDLSRFNSGSVQPMLNRNYIADVEVLRPPVQEQQAIAGTLGDLDAKIESNRRLAAGISDLMEARIEQALHEDRRKLPVSNLGAFVNGGAYTKGASGAGRIVIRIAELNKGLGPSTVYNDIDVPEDKTARSGDILMSWSGSLGVYRWTRDEAIINQHIFKVIPGAYPAWLVFDRLNAAIEVFRGIAKDKATTMGHIQRSHLETTFVDVPTDSAIKVLDNDLGPLWDRLLLAERESLKLADLRETLLPALLSGTIRVCDENDSMTGAEDEGER